MAGMQLLPSILNSRSFHICFCIGLSSFFFSHCFSIQPLWASMLAEENLVLEKCGTNKSSFFLSTIQDRERTETYRNAIMHHQKHIAGKVSINLEWLIWIALCPSNLLIYLCVINLVMVISSVHVLTQQPTNIGNNKRTMMLLLSLFPSYPICSFPRSFCWHSSLEFEALALFPCSCSTHVLYFLRTL